MTACPAVDAQSGLIRGVLQAVDCQTRRFAQSGYDTLADPASPFQAWLTAFLVIYIALQSGLIRGVLQAVDCQTRRFAQSGYDTLADPASPFQAWLTAFLVIYIAL